MAYRENTRKNKNAAKPTLLLGKLYGNDEWKAERVAKGRRGA